jgi:hypothetical protein
LDSINFQSSLQLVFLTSFVANYNQAKSGGKEQMLNFFVRLDNIIGLPVIVVGTNKATKILQGDFRQGRRREGIGSIYWDRFKIENDEQKRLWDFFVSPLFDYQFTEESADFTDEFSHILYDESQGITDIAVKLYMLTQFRAIITNQKKITPSLMIKVALEDLQLVRPMLNALRSGSPNEIAKYDDIKPLDISNVYEEYKKKLELESQRKLEKQREKFKKNRQNEVEINQLFLEVSEFNMLPTQARKLAEKVYSERESDDTLLDLVKKARQLTLTDIFYVQSEVKQPQHLKPLKTKTISIPGDLRNFFKEAKKLKVPVYHTFNEYGVIKSPLKEFII